MKHNLFSVIAVLVTSSLVVINGPANAKPSTYQLSCNNIYSRGNILSATCRRANGTFRRTSILLRGIENINGVLRYTSSP